MITWLGRARAQIIGEAVDRVTTDVDDATVSPWSTIHSYAMRRIIVHFDRL